MLILITYVEAFEFLQFSGLDSYWPVLACSADAWLPRGASVHVSDLLSLVGTISIADPRVIQPCIVD